jgi:Putative prokaryotic signal transducing protein
MKKRDNLIKVFTGSEFSVFLLKGKLDEIGISSIVRNDFNGAFLGTVSPTADLLINESDLEAAEPIIREFIQNDKV